MTRSAFVLFTLGLTALVYGLIESGFKGWGSTEVVVSLIVAGVSLAVFPVAEHFISEPMFNLALFKKPTFVGGSIAAFGMNGSLYALFLYIVLYFQNAQHFSPLGCGWRLAIITAGALVTAIPAGRLSARVPVRFLIGPGLLLVGIGLLLMRGLSADSSWTHLIPGFLVAGIGSGLVNAPAGIDRGRRGPAPGRRHGERHQHDLPPDRHRHRGRGARLDLRDRSSSSATPATLGGPLRERAERAGADHRIAGARGQRLRGGADPAQGLHRPHARRDGCAIRSAWAWPAALRTKWVNLAGLELDATETALLERESELSALADALEMVPGGRGQVVLVEGNAGTGKSTLLSAAVTAGRAAGLEVVRARGGELEREHPYGLIRQLLEPAVRRLDPAARVELLTGAAAPTARLLDLDGDAGPVTDGFAAAHAIFWLVAGLAARSPLLIAVDDAHWGDVSSLRALDHLARRIDDLGIGLLVTLRPAEPGAPAALLDELRQAPGAIQLRPAPLSRTAVARVVRHRWPQAPDAVGDACAEVTAGNPLLLTELLRALPPGPEPPTAQAVVSASIPTLEERVLRRAGSVAPRASGVARAMAVLGDGARLTTAAALAGVDADVAATLAHGLRRMEVLASEDPVAFVHPLVRRSLYDGIPSPERHQLHVRAAELLAAGGAPAEAAAAHLAVLPPAGSVAVASAQLRAAESAVGRAAPAEAISWLERGLAEGAPDPPPAVLLARLGLARSTLRDPASIPVLQEAFDTLQEPELRRAVAVELSYSLAVAGAWERAAEMIERAERVLSGDPAAISDLAAIRATLELHDARRITSFERRRPELERIARGDDWGSCAVATVLATEAAYRGRIDDAQRELVLARRGDRLVRERGGGGWVVPLLLGVPIIIDDLTQAETMIEEAERAARASGSVLGSLSATACAAWLRARRGDLIGAEFDLSTVLHLGQEAEMAMLVANVALFLIDVLLERDGAAPAAAAILEVPVPPEFLPTWSGAMLLEARGRLRLARGDQERGIEDLRAAGRTAEPLGFGPSISGWRSALALALPSDAAEEALRLADEELGLARASGLTRAQGVSLRTLGILHARGDAGIAHLRESAAILENGPSRLEHARSLVALGGALRRGNRVREARSALNAGLDLAIACGADRLTKSAEQELLAAGGRRRSHEESGVQALTASELRVARLAAAGHSNVDVAQQLYISVKTVETHLAHAYGKLGLSGAGSRWRLAGLLGEDA